MGYVHTGEAQEHYGVSIDTLRNWEKKGKIKTIRTAGGHRRYFVPEKNEGKKIIYARVSSSKQSDNLDNQIKYLKERYPTHELIQDIGSGINFERRGFRKILDELFANNIQEVVVTSKDRLCRFGNELFEYMFHKFGARLEILNSNEHVSKTPNEELAEDLLSIVTVFTARYHGSRKYKNSKKKQKNNKKERSESGSGSESDSD